MIRYLQVVGLAVALLMGAPVVFATETMSPWRALAHVAVSLEDRSSLPVELEARDVVVIESPHSPGILLRMRSKNVRFFTGLDRYGAESPQRVWLRTRDGFHMLRVGDRVSGERMQSSWLLASFQGARGWEVFDAPWLLALERRPTAVELTVQGLRIEYPTVAGSWIFSMPLYGYEKPPQQSDPFAQNYGLPLMGVEPWTWQSALPQVVAARCDWWAATGKAFPVAFSESFRVAPAEDRIDFRQDYRYLTLSDDWDTTPRRFASLPPAVALARRTGGLPFSSEAELHDANYWTAFGPLVGVLDSDRLEYTLPILDYLNRAETVSASAHPGGAAVLRSIRASMAQKFPAAWKYDFDHGDRSNFAWNLAGDVWYPRALQFLDPPTHRRAASSLRVYMAEEVLQPHSPYHGKYLLHGPGIGSWGESGDAGKFMALALQPIWAYAEFSGDWDLIRSRWDLIRRFFTSPDESDWLSYGRRAIAELGDEAAPAVAYARLAWGAGDRDAYLFGAYQFAREIVHLHLKQKAGPEFYARQPYHQPEPMPARIYPTDVWGSTAGWQVDGPKWTSLPSGEHQSSNRWFRFQDPDVGRYVRDHLAEEVGQELDWYTTAAQRGSDLDRAQAFRDWLSKDDPHGLPSLLRLRSLLLDRRPRTSQSTVLEKHHRGWPAADIATAYSLLRLVAPRELVPVGPVGGKPSPWVLGLERNGLDESGSPVQELRVEGLTVEPLWFGWGMPRNAPSGGPRGSRSFGRITGDFPGRVRGAAGVANLSYGVRAHWANAVPKPEEPRTTPVFDQAQTPVLVSGPYPNPHDEEILTHAYPPESSAQSRLVSWNPRRLDSARRIDLSTNLRTPDGEPSLAYVRQDVWAPGEIRAYLLAGHQGGLAAWINHEPVLREHGRHHSTGDDASRGLARLRPGWNRVLLKFESFTDQSVLQFRLVGLDDQPIPGLRFAAHAPEYSQARAEVQP